MYQRILFFPESLKGRRVWLEEARETVSRAVGEALDPLFWNRDAGGRTLQRGPLEDHQGAGPAPSITYDGGIGYVEVIGIGRRGCEVLSRNARLLVEGLSKTYGPLRVKTYSGDCTVRKAPARIYRFHRLGLTKKGHHLDKLEKAGDGFSLASAEGLIRRAIINGIVSQARLLDEETGSCLEAELPHDQGWDIQILGGELTVPKLTAGYRFLMAKGLIVGMNLDLKGPWYAGILRSTGRGGLRLWSPEAALKEAA